MCPNLIPFEASREAPLSVDGVARRRREGGSGEDEGGGGGIPDRIGQISEVLKML